MPTAGPLTELALGPYRALEFLGQGGMGRVFRAQHRDSGEQVALKTVRAVDETRIASIRREIHALSLLRHRGVVRIADQGVSEGMPWYAMELLRGPTLARLLEDGTEGSGPSSSAPRTATATATATVVELSSWRAAQTGELADRARADAESPAAAAAWASLSTTPRVALLQIIRALCPPLAYLHGRGIVHRDLKPDNIFLRDDGSPIITDLGIATRFGGAHSREELVVDNKIVGTCRYMAPEHIRGEDVDARADLYALGCILYECLTGRPPFIGPTAQVLAQHLDAQPEPPSRLVPELEPGFDELALSLLAKDPKARLGYAEDVDFALEHLGVPAPLAAEEPRAQAYLYRPRLAGRDAPLAELGECLGAAVEGQGSVVYVGGESGVGKTRLAMELARMARLRGATVVSGQCQAPSPGDRRVQAAPLHPLRPLLQTMADRCRALGPDTTERLLGKQGPVLAVHESSLASVPYHVDPGEPAELPPQQARERLLHALRTTLLALAAERPLLLVLDDLQWADELSQELLRSLDADELAAAHLLIVGTYRMDEAGPELEALTRARGAGHIELGRLGTAGVRAIIGDMLALDDPPGRFAEFLTETTSGNPFFVAEYMQSAIGEGLIKRGRDGIWRVEATGRVLEEALPLPRSLAGLIERRIAGLDQDCRALLELGAVLGRAFEGELLTWAAEIQGEAVMVAVERLRRRQILEEGEAGRLRFVHDKLREISYAAIAAPERAGLHRRAAEAVERFHGEDPAWSRSLAHHFADAGLPERAAPAFLRAGDYARSSYANREARELYRVGVEHMRGLVPEAAWKEPLARGWESLGDMRGICGLQGEAREAYDEALGHRCANTDAPVVLARLRRKLGTSWQTHHRHDAALAAYDAAEAALGEPPEGAADWWQEWFQLQNDRIYVHYWLAEVDPMTALIDRVRPVIEERGTPIQRAAFFDGLLHLGLRRRRYQLDDEDLSAARQALEAALASADLACIANARFMLGLALLFAGELGELAEADDEMTRAVKEAEHLGDITLVSRCLTYAAIIARRRGWVAATERLAERSLDAAREARMLDYEGAARANLAWVAWRRNDVSSAREHVDAALTLWDELAASYPYGMQWPGRLLALLLDCDAGNTDRAVEHARVLLEPVQVALPTGLSTALSAAVVAWESGDTKRCEERIAHAMDSAMHIGYL